jgi:hypothetical protein
MKVISVPCQFGHNEISIQGDAQLLSVGFSPGLVAYFLVDERDQSRESFKFFVAHTDEALPNPETLRYITTVTGISHVLHVFAR